ncbi:MAG: FAD-dependent oxidoreductase [Dehalococcoidia bacterium]|nr:FAD-dependent oxidoreductase [Dehalococcoidia bacterium]
MDERFDAIVVGAGPAGCAAAYSMAKEGLQVLLVERGKFAGAKNMTGGVLYGPVLNDLVPDFWKEAPVERHISRHVIAFLSERSSLSVDFNVTGSDEHNGFSVLRSKFDRWFAHKVEQVGGIVATGLRVDDLLWDKQRVAGIVAGGDEIAGEVVIAADGVNSGLAKKAGLGVKLSPENVNQGVKEVIKMPREVIEERFNLADESGAAIHFLGFCTKGVHGGGFLYTNKESLSLGVVAQLKALAENNLKSVDLLEGFKAHPTVKELIKGGTTVEYSAHLVPAGGLKMMPRLYTDGLLVAGDAAALVLATGRALEGINFALASGMAAAETVKRAKEKGDYGKETLSKYEDLLADSFALRDLKNFRRAPHFLENQRIYSTYPDLVCSLAEKVFQVDGNPKERVWQLAREEMKGKVSIWQLIRDAMSARRAI